MRKFKLGSVYDADIFYDNIIDSSGDNGFYHFKIIEIVYCIDGSPAQYLGIKTGMSDYRNVENGFVWSFGLDGKSLNTDRSVSFELNRAISRKKNIKLEQIRRRI